MRAVIVVRLILIGIIVAVCAPVLLMVFLDVLSTRNGSSHFLTTTEMQNGPSHFLTTTEMSLIECKWDIQRYAIEHNALPSHEMMDCWGHPISYSVDSSGMVTLTSYGKDNKPGGTGSDADMVGRYRSRQPDGKWSDESVDWAKDPYPPEPPDARKPSGQETAVTSR